MAEGNLLIKYSGTKTCVIADGNWDVLASTQGYVRIYAQAYKSTYELLDLNV